MSRPRWLEPLLDAELMRATDRWAIDERGIPSLDLMERAGEGLAGVIAERVPSGRIAVVCGKGNNGGDGLVAARRLRAGGRDVDVLRLWEPDELSADAGAQLGRLPGAAPVRYDASRLEGASGVVDALLGTGTTGAPRAPFAGAIEDLNGAAGATIAADIPSGVDASTGEVAGIAVRAAATATFHAAKPGLWIAPGKEHAGAVTVVDIGIPAGAAPGEPDAGLIAPEVLRGLPGRGAASTKFSSGNVVVVGGSRGLTGAPTMAALAAARGGAGYVTVAAPESLEPAIAARLLEAMFVGLPEDGGALSQEALEPAVKAVGRADAVVLGPGLGRSPGAQALARELMQRIDVPLVIDADGLNALAGRLELLHRRRWPTVLTPHAGELGRLLELESSAIGRARLAHARAAAARAKALVVLKGDDTLVAAPSGRVAISPGGAPALATAGTGDVLAGLTGALLARGLSHAHAACAAVYAHVRAGRLAAAPHGPDGVIASDVIAALPAALAA
jgi:ADP-dependent NAD(P)H-hydrate dehydratase / NAD(P)H-hydrate epimerase